MPDATSTSTRTYPTVPIPSRDAVLICPLGGVSDIGMNWTLYGYADRFVLVDAGSGFAPREVDGVEAVFPDPKVLKSLGDRLVGLVVTHFHEDHVGAIHRAWPRYASCAIHAPPFASAMLTNRFREKDTLKHVRIRPFKAGEELRLGPFSIRTVAVAHSTPDCVALAIRAGGSTVLHTGDWKVDERPGVGHTTDFASFARLGDAGVDLMLCDSTNADRNDPPSSEASVERAFTRIFNQAKGMVVVSSFGSNVARMASVGKAAAKSNRKVALAGRALRNAEEVATKLGLMKGMPRFLDDVSAFKGLDRRNRALMCTGTQGEENASLSKLAARSSWRLPHVQPGDVVIHSARAIPGNEDYIHAVLDKLRAQGATIITADYKADGDPIHVTGHPCVPDLVRMYQAVRPRVAMPVHGSPKHLEAHARVARGQGVPTVLTPLQGHLYELRHGAVACVGRLDNGYVAVLGDEAGTVVGWDERASRPALEDAARMAAALAVPPSTRGRHKGAGPRDGRTRAANGREGGAPNAREAKGGRNVGARGSDVRAADVARKDEPRRGNGRDGGRRDVAAPSYGAALAAPLLPTVHRRDDGPAVPEREATCRNAAGTPGTRSVALDLDFIRSFGGHAPLPGEGGRRARGGQGRGGQGRPGQQAPSMR